MTACSGGGPQFPFDTGYQDSADLAQEYAEGQEELRSYDYNAYDKAIHPGYDEDYYDPACEPPPFQEEDWTQPAYCRDGSSAPNTNVSPSGCLNGCTTHKSGCDIKGNISYNTKEKIYHVPGQNFYNETKISPGDGERWFCTEGEAKANGWRKAKN